MNKRQDKWLKKFIRLFDLKKYSSCLYSDSIRILRLLNSKDKFKHNPKLLIFLNNGWFDEFIITKDKLVYLNRFEKLYKKHSLLDPKRARRDLKPNRKSIIKHNNSQPLIFNSIKLEKVILKTVRGAKKKNSTCTIEPTKVSYRKKIWLSIGINDYKGLPSLSNAVNDAVQIGKFSSEKLGFESIVLKNNQARKYNIEKEIKKILYQICTPNDLVVISFHGHGETILINGKSTGFIVPFLDSCYSNNPFDLISMEELCNWSNYLSANHVLFIMDCCFSGFTAMRCDNKVKNCIFSEITLKNLISRKSRIVINAGTNDQQVLDGGWDNNSILTGLIISYPFYQKTLGSACHLYNYLLEQVPKRNISQTPTIGKLKGDMGGDIFLGL